MMRREFARFLAGLLGAAAAPVTAAPADPAAELTAILQEVRERYSPPALAGALLREGAPATVQAVGVRKQGDPTPVTAGDRFHLGSCTKAMTAVLLALLVEERKLTWETTLAAGFPDLAAKMDPGWRAVTLDHLLQHRGGFPGRSWPEGMEFGEVHNLPGAPREQRREYVRRFLTEKPGFAPGARFEYANAGYAVAGALAERVTGIPWEELLRRRLFQPLGMTTAGFGAMGSPGRVLQPWQHRRKGKSVEPIEPGRFADNPPAIGPGGTVHASLGDWAKFVSAVLAGSRGEARLLRSDTWGHLLTPRFGGGYAGGWLITERPWAGGKALTHSGSNTQNFCVAWLAPNRNFGALIATNVGGDQDFAMCDAVAAKVIGKFL